MYLSSTQPRTRWKHYLGPVLSVIAVVGSVGYLANTLVTRQGEPPELLRLGPPIAAERLALVRAPGPAMAARGLAGVASQDVVQTVARVVERMLDSTAAPSEVKYTVSRGGTLRDVANMYGIYHHEITALNPEFGLDAELPAGARVLVYRRDPEKPSRSLGKPSSGRLENAVPIMEGPGRILRANRLKSWATSGTIARLDQVLKQWAVRYPDAPPILVGNLSLRQGGKVSPHRTHQSGRDIDLSFVAVWDGVSPPQWSAMNATNFDAGRNWELLRLLEETQSIAVIFVDYELQKLLYDDAVERALFEPEALARWLEYPDGVGAGGRLIVHAPGHADHIHARFRCSPAETDCQEDGNNAYRDQQ